MKTSPPGKKLNPEAAEPGLWGALNQFPKELLATSSRILAAMSTEPALTRARREMLNGLGLAVGNQVMEAGCGTGTALADVLPVIGSRGRVVGVDATAAFIQEARERAMRIGATQVEYREADVCALPFASGAFDAAFCDKLLTHVDAHSPALSELARVTRQGGRVGAVEWTAHLSLSTIHPEHEARINGVLRASVQNVSAGPNLARTFRQVGLSQITTRRYLAEADSLSDHPFWRALLIDQLPLFVHARLMTPAEARAFAEEVKALDESGDFRAAFVIWTACGTKGPPAPLPG